MVLNSFAVERIIKQALEEDWGFGDLSSSLIPESLKVRAIIYAKEAGIIAGLEIAKKTFAYVDENLIFTPLLQDGENVASGQEIAYVSGSAQKILLAERVMLNFLQHMSGIATKTAAFVKLTAGTKARIVDTRKTLPGLRMLEKYAVKAGGGHNHRFGLFDAVMIKDNHIKALGGITKAVEEARRQNSHTVKIEVEVENLQQVEEALQAGPDIIMLDNMPLAMMEQAVKLIDGQAVVEASGNVTEETVAQIAAAGVDIISSGALTHSVKALDISLDLNMVKGKNQ
ncbi:MAG: carboxylating nicotinate-nucleotide diphosphorylase [bacterium]